jgi:hypothetical protein
VDTDQGWAFPDIEAGHVESVDGKGLHGGSCGWKGAIELRYDIPRSPELVYAVKFPQVSGG